MAKAKAIICKQCDGVMTTKRVAKHSQFAALLFIIVGIILCCTFVGALIGVPLILVGLYFGIGINTFWVCRNCGTRVEKHR